MAASGCQLCGKELCGRNVSGYCRSCFWKSPENRLEWGFHSDSIAAGRNQAAKMYPLDNVECERCENLATERHHIDGDTHNNERSNIEFLCKSCHTNLTMIENWTRPEYRERQTTINQGPRLRKV